MIMVGGKELLRITRTAVAFVGLNKVTAKFELLQTVK
jgi:hypothetical protein